MVFHYRVHANKSWIKLGSAFDTQQGRYKGKWWDKGLRYSIIGTSLPAYPGLPQPFNYPMSPWILSPRCCSSALYSSLNSVTCDLKSGASDLYTITAICLQSAARGSVKRSPPYLLPVLQLHSILIYFDWRWGNMVIRDFKTELLVVP